MVSGLTRHRELSDTIVRVLGDRNDGRVVGETAGKQIALKPVNLSILEFTEDFEKIQKRGSGAPRFSHPDKFGCRYSFALLHMIVKAKL